MKKTSLLVALCIATVLVWANCGSDTTIVDTTKTIHFCEADTIVADTTVKPATNLIVAENDTTVQDTTVVVAPAPTELI